MPTHLRYLLLVIRAVCFDFDGTLAQYRGNFMTLTALVAARLGIQHDLRKLVAQFDIEQRCEGKQNYQDALEHTLESLGLKVPPILAEVAQEAIQAYVREMQLLPGSLEILDYLSHLPLAIITNGPSDMQRAAIAKVGLTGRFKTILASGDADIAVRKPNPRIFQIAAERLGVPIEACLMIGDNLEADVQGAIAAGMQGIYRP